MATDVEVSPKQTIMNYIKTPPTSCNTTRTKGIRDFFSAGPKVASTVNNTVSEALETSSQAHVGTASETEAELKRKKECGPEEKKNVLSTCKEHKKRKNPNGVEAKQNSHPVNSDEGLASASEDTMTKVSRRGKKSLSTCKKGRDKWTTQCLTEDNHKVKGSNKRSVQSALEDNHKTHEDISKQDETQTMPQEMDYGEFLKTFVQNQDGDCPADRGSTDDNSEQHGVHRNTVTDSAVMKAEDSREQSQTKTGSKKTTNAFSLLMQPKSNKNKKTPNEDDCANVSDSASQGKSAGVTNNEGNSSDELEGVLLETTPTPSVMDFFTKTTKSTKRDGDGSGSVLVEVDIHQDPAERNVTPVRKKSSSLQRQKVQKQPKVNGYGDSEIVFLGSETIEVEDDKADKGGSKKNISKNRSSHLVLPETTASTSGAKVKNSRAEEICDVGKKNAFLQDITTPDHSVKTAQATLHFGQGGKLAMNASIIARNPSDTPKCDVENNDNAEMKKKGAKKKEPVKSACSELKTDHSSKSSTTKIRNRKKQNKLVDSDSENRNDQCGNDQSEQKDLSQENTVTKRRTTRLRKQVESKSGTGEETKEESESDCKEEPGSDSKDFTPHSKNVLAGSASRSRAQELLFKARQHRQDPCHNKQRRGHKPANKPPVYTAKKNQKKQKSAAAQTVKPTQAEKLVEQTSPPSTPEQGSRRQSRRLAEQQKAKEAVEEVNCISVDSDSSCDDAPTPQKKNARKKKELSRGRGKSSPSRPSPKKPAGKLAPIFAKKTKESVDAAPRLPPEDPEVVRKRREFLLSGVPSELKRQAACATPSVSASDFAPFPEHSHVQQKEHGEAENVDVWCLGYPENMTVLCKETLAGDGEMDSLCLEWSSLQWQPTCDERRCARFEFLGPVSETLGTEVKGPLVRDIQHTSPGFPVSALYDKFRERLGVGLTKQDGLADVSAGAKKRKVDPDIVIVDDLEDASAAQGDRDSQWPERLQPRCAEEMVGNGSCIRRLRYWLEEWKALIQREARLSARSAAGVKEDSDFDYSGREDSEGEGGGLCNTMMLVGPHGVGKTAAVYALAQQLSYKVFEVNASSSRQGRHIVAQLQEATQSHQVAQKKDGIILSPPPVTPALCSQSEPPAEKTGKKAASAVPKAFASFFKKAGNATETKTAARSGSPKASKKQKKDSPRKNSKKSKGTAESEPSRKRRKENDEVEIVKEVPSPKKQCSKKKGKRPRDGKDGEESNLAGCLNLTSTSLILFDEVDLVFEEDSGFLQTVQHFIHTTKIPIILTTTDPAFDRHLSARLETLVFKRPSLESVTTYLQTVCLAAGMRTSSDDLKCVADLCQQDLRHGVLTLQFLALSGGGRQRELKAVGLKPWEQHTRPEKKGDKKPAVSASLLTAAGGGGQDSDSDGDFVCLKPRRKKLRRIADDDDGGSTLAPVSVRSEVSKNEDEGSGVVQVSGDRLPKVHLHLCESMLGVSCNVQELLSECIKGDSSSYADQLREEWWKLRARNPDILHDHLLHLLPLPNTALPARWHRPSTPLPLPVKRIRIRSDIFDSEGSDDDDSSQTTVSVKTARGKDNQENGEQEATCFEDGEQVVLLKVGVEASVDMSAENVTTKIEKESGSRTVAVCEESGSAEPMDVDNTLVSGDGGVETSSAQSSKESKTEPETSIKVSCDENHMPKPSLRGSKECTDHGLGSKLLSSFARYYESLSSVDVGLSSSLDHPHSSCVRGRCITQPGIEDVAAVEQERNWRQWPQDVATEVEVRSSRCLWRQVSAQVSSWREDSRSDKLPEDCSLPISSSSTPVFGKAFPHLRVPEPYSRVITDVMDNLPFHIGANAITLDYLPMLRCISQSERCRQIAKTKRRFHHHFDSIGLGLGQSTVAALSADFPAQQQDA
ncbi:uncharacterized protein LOC143286427 [Babylonia areolata]|uniref:uncharacterized protein LOC143286427 n=1 Tax=Babylonia areolata TaxID=304850 RepID=UPI003FD21D78